MELVLAELWEGGDYVFHVSSCCSPLIHPLSKSNSSHVVPLCTRELNLIQHLLIGGPV